MVKMKETVYGWYPSAKDMYIGSNDPKDSYTKECLYRHWNSRYNDKPGTETPCPPTSVKLQLSQRHKPRDRASRTPSATPVRVMSAASTASVKANRVLSAASFTSNKSDRQEATPRPVAYKMRTPDRCQSTISVSMSPKPPTPSPSVPVCKKAWSMHLPETATSPVPHPPSRVSTHDVTSGRPERVRSAAYSRPRHTPPRRDIHSAGPTRSVAEGSRQESTASRPRAPVPPSTSPVPGSGDLRPEEEEQLPDEVCPTPEPLDYDEQLKKHGWRMEIPGDPLNLKRPCFAKRGAYSVSVAIPKVPPLPPRAHMENIETFFSNTIPLKPLSFTIHPEWVSEILFAKRMELQKREGGYKYRHNDFSFVY